MFYILDELFRRSILVDEYESLIWAERFNQLGDFELVIQSTMRHRAWFREGTWLAHPKSDRVMQVETVTDTTDDDGRSLLTVKGPALEKITDDRAALLNLAGAKWELTGTPGEIARSIFYGLCVTGRLSSADIIPHINTSNPYPADTLGEPTQTVTWEVKPQTVYGAIKELCETFDLGFRLLRIDDSSTLYFNIYSGNDRTSAQSSVAAVVFSPALDNLSGVSELTSEAMYKNVAHVISKNGSLTVFSPEAELDVAGFNRRVMVVEANDIDEEVTGPELVAALQKRGEEALTKQRKVTAFDGEILADGKYTYGVDYRLGDMVEMRNADGVVKNMRVSEQIFVSDAQGERSYPTLTDVLFITPGSWFAWDYNQVWEEAVGVWADK